MGVIIRVSTFKSGTRHRIQVIRSLPSIQDAPSSTDATNVTCRLRRIDAEVALHALSKGS